ncbi:MAG: hypothetical protein LBU53_00585, partial [Zoogloeaceae bacterium]|nr:hypothetical protein [Zoogloeaceae bacterium]
MHEFQAEYRRLQRVADEKPTPGKKPQGGFFSDEKRRNRNADQPRNGEQGCVRLQQALRNQKIVMVQSQFGERGKKKEAQVIEHYPAFRQYPFGQGEVAVIKIFRGKIGGQQKEQGQQAQTATAPDELPECYCPQPNGLPLVVLTFENQQFHPDDERDKQQAGFFAEYGRDETQEDSQPGQAILKRGKMPGGRAPCRV